MNFKETLTFARTNGIDTGILSVADEIDAQNLKLNKESFEQICSYVYEIYLKSAYSANELANAVSKLLKYITLKQILNLTQNEFLTMGISYEN